MKAYYAIFCIALVIHSATATPLFGRWLQNIIGQENPEPLRFYVFSRTGILNDNPRSFVRVDGEKVVRASVFQGYGRLVQDASKNLVLRVQQGDKDPQYLALNGDEGSVVGTNIQLVYDAARLEKGNLGAEHTNGMTFGVRDPALSPRTQLVANLHSS